MGLAIVGTGRHLPRDVATNEDLARVMDTTAEWIHQRTGITERQTLTLVVKSEEGKVSAQDLLPVRFSELEEPAGMAGMA